jgi:hypothetical protein
VSLDVTPPDSPIVPLLRAELRELGIDVIDGSAGDAASVTMHVVLTGDSLDVRIVDQPTGRTTVRETFPATTGASMDTRTAVLHAVELLRWHLRFTPASKVSAPAPPPSVEASPAQPSSSAPTSNVRIGMMPVASYSPGGAGVGAGGQIDVLVTWGRLGARALGGSMLLPAALSVPEGSIEVTASWGGLSGVAIVGGDRWATLEIGLGATIFASTLRGKASAGNTSRDDQVLTIAPFGELRLRRRITPGFALTLGAALFVPLESSRLRVLDISTPTPTATEVGRFGQAVIILGLGAELALF